MLNNGYDMFKTLETIKRPIIVNGPVHADNKTRTTNIIRLKKRLIKEIPDLSNNNRIFYRAELWQSYEHLEERIKELKKKKQGIPILIFLYK